MLCVRVVEYVDAMNEIYHFKKIFADLSRRAHFFRVFRIVEYHPRAESAEKFPDPFFRFGIYPGDAIQQRVDGGKLAIYRFLSPRKRCSIEPPRSRSITTVR